MITNARLTKSIAGLLAALLILLSPGGVSYQALAADFAGARAGVRMEAAFAPRLQALAQPQALQRFGDLTVHGVKVGGVLEQLAGVDLNSPAGRLEVAPVLAKIAAQAAPGVVLTDSMLVEALAGAAAEQRAAALAAASRIEKGAGAEDAAELTGALAAARRHWILLGDAERAQVLAQGAAYSHRLEAAKEAKAAELVRGALFGWGKTVVESDVAPVLGSSAKGFTPLSAAQARASSEKAAVPAGAKTAAIDLAVKTADRADNRKALLISLAPIAAAVAAAVLVPALSPVLVLTAGVAGSILLHESAHLWMLRRLGDDTASLHGVRGVSPLKLVDPIGTVLVPIVSAVTSQLLLGVPVLLGWAKPIPVDFNKLADPKKDSMKVALAGPAMNAVIAAIAFALTPLVGVPALLALAKINLALAAFNLIPLPQLDGGKVLVGLLPQKLYDKWTANKRLPETYQSTFKKLYEGPSTLLNVIGIDGQGRVNLVTRAITLGVFGAFAALGWWTLGAPVLLLMLVCSYDYYCIREKIQNEEATRSLMDLLQRFSSQLAAEAESDDSIQSVVNTEEVEHILKNTLEDMIDKVVDSEGFDELSDADKLARFEAAYMDAAVEALSKKGMSADTPETIRRVLTKLGLGALAKGWIEKYDVWAKWHSPLRKKKKSLRDEMKGKGSKSMGAGGTTAMLALAVLGAGMLAGSGFGPAIASAGLAFMAGTLKDAATESPKKQPTFIEAMDSEELHLSDKEKAFLQRMLKEMKLEKKPPVTGRVDELGQLLATITAPRGVINSMVFIGKAGVGKTAVVELLAQLLSQSDAQQETSTFKLRKMNGRYLVKLNLARLLQQDDPAAALDALLEILSKFNSDDKRTGNKVVLFVDEIHQMFDHPKGSQMANLLKEPLRDGELTIVAATTDSEYKKYMENDEAFRRRMIPVRLDESSVAETIRALEGSRGYYEGLFGVKFTPEALKAAAELSKYDQEVFLPGRAFKYMTGAATLADFDGRRDRLSMRISDKMADLRYASDRLSEELAKKSLVTEGLKKEEPTAIELYNLVVKLTQELVALYRERAGIPADGTPVVTDELVKEEIAKKTGVASGQLTLGQEPIEKYLEMEKIVGERVIGQDEAIATIAKTIRQNKAGLSDPKRPMGVFYLTGPTGSGKTHLTKELARFLFNDPEAVIRVDMTEYMESHSVSKFIGSPPGYVGFESGGQLTQKVRQKPYSVVLFDEIEKAHPDVFLILLQILGEGRLTDGQGRLVDFKNTLILMTSNLGMFAVDVQKYADTFAVLQQQERAAKAEGDEDMLGIIAAQKKALAQQLADETKKKSEEVTAQAFKETYPPEFQGRLHAPPIVFNRITPENAVKIAALNLKELRGVLAYAGHELEWTPEVVDHVVNEGFSVALGARPLQNAIDRLITQPIATAILQSAMANGQKVVPSRIQVGIDKGQVTFTVSAVTPKAVKKVEPGEGAAQDVFSNVLTAVLQTAAGQSSPLSLETIDGWVRAAVSLHTSTTSEEVVETEQRQPQAVPVAAVTQQAPAKPATILVSGPAPAMSAPQTFTAAHYENERKDAKVREATEALRGAAPGLDVLTRTVEDAANPYVGWVKLFVEQAKKMTPADLRATPVGVAFEAADSVRVVVTRPGTIGEKEQALLKAHFTGPVPADAVKARDKAEALNVMGKDGRRLMFDLYRQLAAIPGAKLGWEQAEGSVRYWVEVPKAPVPEEAPAPAPTDPALTQAPLDASKRGFADEGMKAAHLAINETMQAARYSRASRTVASAFVRAMTDELKALPDTRGLTLAHAVGEDKTVLRVSRAEPFTQEDTDRILGYFNENLELANGINESGAVLQVRGNSVTLEIPYTRAVTQADGQARSTEAAGTPAPSAGRAAKLQAGATGDPRGVWITFQGAHYETRIKPLLLSLGMRPTERRESGSFVRVRAMLGDRSLASEALVPLLDRADVRTVTVDQALLEGLREAAERAPAAPAPVETPAPGPAASPAPVASAPAVPAGSPLRQLSRDFALRLLAQGESRSTSARVAAADLLGAASTPADLAQARDRVRLENMTQKWPEVAASALVIARHGSRADDEQRLITAMGYLSFGGYGSDLYKPAKRRLVESLAKLLATDNPAKIREYMDRYGEEKEKNTHNRYGGYGTTTNLEPSQFKRYRNDLLVEALYLALCKYAGPEARAMIVDGWDQKRMPQVFEWFKRNEPQTLRALYERWRADHSAPGGMDRLMTLYAVAELGTREDLRRLFDDVSGGWGNTLDNQTTPQAASTVARMIERLGAYDVVAEDVRRALRGSMGDSGNFARTITAVQAAGAGAEHEDLALLEALMRSNPETVNYVHEMTQHDAAEAWAKALNALGLVDRYLAVEKRPGQDLPVLQSMLVDVNPIINEAAMEALRLRLGRGPRRQGPPLGPRPGPRGPQPISVTPNPGTAAFFREGDAQLPADLGWSTRYLHDIEVWAEGAIDALEGLSDARRAQGTQFFKRFSRILEGMLGVSFSTQIRTVGHGDGRRTVVYVLRQAVTQAMEAAKVEKVTQLMTLLLYLSQQPTQARRAQLDHLAELGYEDIDGTYDLLQRLALDPDARMGLLRDAELRHTPGRGETEMWLKFELPAPPRPYSARGELYEQMYGDRGHMGF